MSNLKIIIYTLLCGIFVILFPVLSGVIAAIAKIDAPYVYYLQAIFMIIPLIVLFIVIKVKKIDYRKMGYGKTTWDRKMLFYIPVLLIYIPVSINGFAGKDITSFFGILLLYLMVGITEEAYYRGFSKYLLDKNYTVIPAIIISSLIFGLGHTTSFMTNSNVVETIFVVINAFVFGFMSACLLYLTDTIYPLMFFHFLFDFETKFVVLSGQGLFIAEIIRGAIMFIYTIYLLWIIYKKNKLIK